MSAFNNKEVVSREIERAIRMIQTAPEANHRIAYGSDPCQFGDLFLPSGDGPHPLVVFFHGGWWRSVVGLEYTNHICKRLAEDGVAVWNVEFRRIGETGGGFPETFLDLAAGTDYVAELARQYPIDVNRVVAMGHSAGGHISLWLAGRERVPTTSPIYSRPAIQLRGAVSLSGVVDLRSASEQRILDVLEHRVVVHELLGGTPNSVPDRYDAGNPGQLLPLGTPQILIHGTEDEQVPYKLSEDYSMDAVAAGDSAELVLLEGSNHFDLVDPESVAYQTVKDKVFRLLLPSESKAEVEDMNDHDKIKISKANERMMNAVSLQDVDDLASLYTEQAKIVPPGSDALVGIVNIKEYWNQSLKGGLSKLALNTLELSYGGKEYLRELGEATLEIKQGEETINISTKYTVLWKLENEEWKMDTDIMF